MSFAIWEKSALRIEHKKLTEKKKSLNKKCAFPHMDIVLVESGRNIMFCEDGDKL